MCCAYVRTYIHMYVCTYIHTCFHPNMYVRTYVRTYVCTYVCGWFLATFVVVSGYWLPRLNKISYPMCNVCTLLCCLFCVPVHMYVHTYVCSVLLASYESDMLGSDWCAWQVYSYYGRIQKQVGAKTKAFPDELEAQTATCHVVNKHPYTVTPQHYSVTYVFLSLLKALCLPISIHIICIKVSTYVCTYVNVYVYMHTCLCVCMYVCVYIMCMCMCSGCFLLFVQCNMHICTDVCTFLCANTDALSTCVPTYICMDVRTHVYMHTYMCMYVIVC